MILKKINIKSFVIIISLIFGSIVLFSINNITNIPVNYRKYYKDTLNKTALIIIEGKNVNDNILLFCIPQTKEEALIFFDLDYSKEKQYNYVYRELNKLWLNKCIEKQKEFVIKYFEFSKFVDGYFAEDYFINIKKLYNKIGNKLCSYLDKCSQNKIKGLLLFLKENNMCK